MGRAILYLIKFIPSYKIFLSKNYGSHLGIDDKEYLNHGVKFSNDDKDILHTSLKSLQNIKYSSGTLTIGNVEIFNLLISKLDIPKRWKLRLSRHFWREDYFNDLLNLVWRSKTNINESGWFAELKIPYSALRFPNSNVQDWNINFGRQISRFREENTWNPVNPDLENYLLESGKVKGVNNISPPLRLAFIPFLSSYVNFSKESETLSSFNGGMDICLLYTSPSPRDATLSRMPSSA